LFNIGSTTNPIAPSSATLLDRLQRLQPSFPNIASSTRLAEGGSTSGSHQLADYEEFELADCTPLQRSKEQDVRYYNREAKKAEKICRLDEADEMKFSHSIQFNAVPDWSSHYIAYSNLKKLYVCIHSSLHYKTLETDLN